MACAGLGLVAACDGDDDSNSAGAGGSAAHAASGGSTNAGRGGTGPSSGKGGASGRGGSAGKGGSGGRGGANPSTGGTNGGQAGGGVSGNTEAGNAGGGVGGATESGCEPLLTNGLDTGLDRCTDGTVRRRAAKSCPLPAATSGTSQCDGCSHCCEADSDCAPGGSDGPVGICANAHGLAGLCGCFTGCFKDADCGPGSVCDCGSVFGQCVPATCRVNGDCGEGLHCVRSVIAQFSGGAGGGNGGEGGRAPCVWGSSDTFVCETPTDQCRTNLDCGDGDCVVLDGKHVCIAECPI